MCRFPAYTIASLCLTIALTASAQIGTGWAVANFSERFEYESNDIGHSISPPPASFNNGVCAFTRSGNVDRTQLLTHRSNRAEIRLNDDYSTGSRQFQADILIRTPTTGETIHQIFNGPTGPWLLIKETSVDNGSLHVGAATASLATNLYGHWFRFNSINEMGNNKTHLYINGKLVWTGTNPGGTFYTKYGVYGTHSDTDTADVIFSNIVFFSGGNSVGQDFTLNATPSSQSVTAGNDVAYTVSADFTNTVNNTVFFSVSGVPAGATASFSPSSVVGSGSSTLTVSTSGSTTPGTYPLTITGATSTSSDITHTTTATLTVNPAQNFSGVWELQNEASGLVLNNQGSLTNGSAITQWAIRTNANLQWTFIPTSNGYYQINSVKSGLDAVVQSASTAAGAKIIQWQFGASGDDQWKPVQNSDGSYTFFNLKSGMVLEDPGSSTSTSTQMDQWGANGGANQNWKLITQ